VIRWSRPAKSSQALALRSRIVLDGAARQLLAGTLSMPAGAVLVVRVCWTRPTTWSDGTSCLGPDHPPSGPVMGRP
jgi:hypothetical protein